jgi:acyl carrier protein
MDVKQVVITTICEQLFVSEEEIKPETTLADLGADSLDIIEFMIVFEDVFDMDEIPDGDLELTMSVAQLADYLQKRVKKAA